MKISVFEIATGRIIKCVSCQAADVALQYNANTHDFIEGEYADNQYYVSNGLALQMPTSPGEYFVFDYTTKQWIDPRTLADLKAAKNDAINRARAAANTSFFMFQGKQILVDPLSRSDIDAAHGAILMLQALPPGWPGAWKAADNTYVLIPDVATWAQFYGTMVATGTANFNHSQVLKTQLAAATTFAEVDAVPNW